MPSIKRLAEEEANSTPNASRQRIDGNDYAGSGRKKTAGGSSRTGQACDRCKIRKIRCDARLGGCSPCLQNNTECKTTDRITGRATSRGHTELLENENTNMKLYIIELQAQLKQNGVEPAPPPVAEPGYPPPQLPYGVSWDGQQSSGYGQHAQTERHGSQGSLLPEFRAGCIGDNYLGVASENNWLSPIEGTSLALFGTKIDLAEFTPQEPNPEASATSYQTFLTHAFGGLQPAQRPDLPNFEQCKIFAEWYFRSIQQFIPLLHKPDFMQLLIGIYHEGHQPSPAEAVMVHMMLAVMNFQWSSRNIGSEQTRNTAYEHYHYALTFIPQLIEGHQLEDIQALALICSWLRSQPRPGAAWMFTNMVLGLAIELGLHRSAKAWKAATEQDAHTIEMRKRVFWSLMLFHVAISGKLGRPMPLRSEDFDIEIPDAVNDNLLSEANMTKWKKCSFRAGIQGFKLLKIMMRTYSTVYAVRTPQGPYDVHVRQIEKDLQAFQSQLPQELAGGPQTRDEDRIPALYLQLSAAELDLLLHHPSLCRSNSPQTASSNLDVCLDASNKMLAAAIMLKQLKSLDTTWYYATDFLAAIFTTLFAFTEKRDEVTSDSLQHLRQDMEQWLDIMGEVGKLLGTGPKLQEAVRNIVEYSLSHINRHLTAKTASAAIASAGSPTGPTGHEQHQQSYDTAPDYYTPTTNGAANGDMSAPHQRHYSMDAQSAHPDSAQNGYPPGAHFAYAEPQSAAMPQYHNTAMNAYDTSAYNADGMKSNIEAQLNAELAPPPAQQHHQQTPQPHQQMTPHPQQAPNFMAAFQSPAPPPNGFQPAQASSLQPFPNPGPAAWRHFANSMVDNISGQENYAGIALAGATQANTSIPGASGTPMVAATFGGMQMPTDGTQSWPMIQFQGNTANANGGGVGQ